LELADPDLPAIAVQVQRTPAPAAADVLYVHGATFGADLSVFFPFDGRSWADALVAEGWNTWGFDFTGFGASARHPADLPRPAGTIEEHPRCIALSAHSLGTVLPLSAAGAERAVVKPGA
jgi:pimeloyl-ACP methyl ester carboxylesterase